MDPRKYLAEGIGTYILVFIGCGACVLAEVDQSLSHLAVSAVWGGIVTLMILSFANTSGAHINPAVSLAFYFQKKINLKELIGYVIVQIIGASLAALSLKQLYPESHFLGASLPGGDYLSVFAVEFLLSFALMATILLAVKFSGKKMVVAILVGLCVGLDAYFGGPFTGASMNPARSIGPNLVSGHPEGLWIYIIAPSIACLSALFIFNKLPIHEKPIGSLHR